MTDQVRTALAYRQGARLCVDDHPDFRDDCHQCTAWLAVREHIMELAEDQEKALRAAYARGRDDMDYVATCEYDGTDVHPDLKPNTDKGVAAGTAVFTEGRDHGD